MLARIRTGKVVSSRFMATLAAHEEFSIHVKLNPTTPSSGTVKESVLANGIKIVTRDASSPIVKLKVSINGGSGAESAAQHGASLVLSRGAFIGNPVNTGLRMMRNLEDVGARVSTSSDRDAIVYKIAVLADQVEAVVDTLAIEVSNAPQDFRITEAQAAANASQASLLGAPAAHLDELIIEAAYGSKSAYGHSAYAFDSPSVPSISAYRAASFTGSNIVVSAHGIAHDALSALVQKSFGAIPAGVSVSAKSPYVGGEVRQRQAGSDVHFAVAFPVPIGDAGKGYAGIFTALSAFKKSLNDGGMITPFFNKNASGGIVGVSFFGSLATSEQVGNVISAIKNIANGSPTVEGIKTKTILNAALAVDAKCESSVSASSASDLTAAAISDAAKSILKSNPSVAVLGNVTHSVTHSEIAAMLK